MMDYVSDTVALVVRLENRTLGKSAWQAFHDIEQGNATLYIPGMVFAEILYLAEKKRIVATLADVQAYINLYPSCSESPLTFEIVNLARKITDIPELHDRLIAATAAFLGAPLITTDSIIGASRHLKTIW